MLEVLKCYRIYRFSTAAGGGFLGNPRAERPLEAGRGDTATAPARRPGEKYGEKA
jgi:hypothetical protein